MRYLLPLALLMSHLLFVKSAIADPEIRIRKGESIQVDYKDGRVAEIFYQNNLPMIFTFPTEVVETTCRGSKSGQTCNLNFYYQENELALKWIKHPDQRKVGLNVKDFFEITQSRSITSAHRHSNPDLTKNLPKDNLECSNYEWLPKPNSPPLSSEFMSSEFGFENIENTFNVVSIDREFMFLNPETGVNENIIVGGMDDLKFSKSMSGFQLESVGYIDLYRFLIDFPFSADTLSWHFKDPNSSTGSECQVTLKPNISKLRADQVLYRNKSMNGTFTKYIFGQDSFWDHAGFRNRLTLINQGNQ